MEDKMEYREIHKKFVEYGQNARKWLRQCALLLPEIDRLRIWEKKGFSSIYEYAGKLAGMSKSSVTESLRVLRKIEDKPLLRKVAEEKGIHAVRPVASIATKETEGFWAKKAREMAKNTLETYVREYRREILPGEGSKPVNGELGLGFVTEESLPGEGYEPVTVTVTMELSPEVLDRLHKIKGDKDWNEVITELMELKALVSAFGLKKAVGSNKGTATLKQETDFPEKPKPVKTKSRHIPKTIQNYAVSKYGGICGYPECRKPYEILHHTKRFSIEKVHDPDRIIPLCREHERIAHHNLIENEEDNPKLWELRKEPDMTDFKYFIDRKVMAYREGGG